jgi:hypothetical protein
MYGVEGLIGNAVTHTAQVVVADDLATTGDKILIPAYAPVHLQALGAFCLTALTGAQGVLSLDVRTTIGSDVGRVNGFLTMTLPLLTAGKWTMAGLDLHVPSGHQIVVKCTTAVGAGTAKIWLIYHGVAPKRDTRFVKPTATGGVMVQPLQTVGPQLAGQPPLGDGGGYLFDPEEEARLLGRGKLRLEGRPTKETQEAPAPQETQEAPAPQPA